MIEKKAQSGEFTLPVRVYIEDTDAGGIVYYVNYLKFMERARTEFMRSLGYQHYALADENFQFVVHSANVQYRQPARIDDALTVTAALKKLGKATLLFEQQVRRGDALLCEAEIKVACVSADSLKPTAIPSALYNKFNTASEGEGLHG
ncbi:MAG: tol-pal system-associated acyl-CoA thioesterase [Pseudomonadales bacterium]|nr:tol-pal system-associated acyl-CoA thioesterase [Pseudomonadales bacterium]